MSSWDLTRYQEIELKHKAGYRHHQSRVTKNQRGCILNQAQMVFLRELCQDFMAKP